MAVSHSPKQFPNSAPAVRRFLRIRAVLEQTGLSRSALYAHIAEGRFPRGVSIGERAVAWPSDEVAAWIDERVASSRRAS